MDYGGKKIKFHRAIKNFIQLKLFSQTLGFFLYFSNFLPVIQGISGYVENTPPKLPAEWVTCFNFALYTL